MNLYSYSDAPQRAVTLSRKCPPSNTAFSVGAIVFDAQGVEVATGYSRETDPKSHAEEVALEKAGLSSRDVRGGTFVSSLEPCGRRLSGRPSCADLIIHAGIAHVVYILPEPAIFVERTGEEKLKAAGVEVVVMPELAKLVEQINAHLYKKREGNYSQPNSEYITPSW